MYQDLKLSDRARVIKMAVESGIRDLDTIEQVFNTFAQGGDLEETEPSTRRNYNGVPVTLEDYQRMQAQVLTDAAVKNALARKVGVAPIVDGEALASCAYTATDNWGKDRREASTKVLLENAGVNGWEIAGPISKDRDMIGNLYIMINENGVPDHTNLITATDANGNPLITYSQGHAGGKPAPTREEWEKVAAAQRAMNGVVESYEDYVKRMAIVNSPENDYKKNQPIWRTPGYETLQFVGTPADKARWASEWEALQGYPQAVMIGTPPVLNNRVQTQHKFEEGGPEGGLQPSFGGEIKQGKKFTAWDRYVADHPMVGHRVRKAKTLLADAARIPRVTGLIMDAYDLVTQKDPRVKTTYEELNDYATALGGAGRALRLLYEGPFRKIGETEFANGVGLVGKILTVPDTAMDSIQFIKDFTEPVENYCRGGKLMTKL